MKARKSADWNYLDRRNSGSKGRASNGFSLKTRWLSNRLRYLLVFCPERVSQNLRASEDP